MSRYSRLREELRPHGVVSVKCPICLHYGDCGGIEPKRLLFKEDCFDVSCHRSDPTDNPCRNGTCNNVCPHNEQFLHRCSEVGGLQFDNIPKIDQSPTTLPRYVPLVHHGYGRSESLDWPVVGLKAYEILRLDNAGLYRPVADSPEALRAKFRLHPNTKIVVVGTDRDPPLERYWKYRRRDAVPQAMARLGISLAIGPNFSHFLDVPRTDNLFNRKRQLICLAEMASSGLSPVPHLSAVTPADWLYWKEFLRSNTTVRYAAVEFQTGNKQKAQGGKVIQRLSRLQKELGRPLHMIVIGGCQFLTRLAYEFDEFTLIDSSPFMKAVKRRSFDGSKAGRAWLENRTKPGESIDGLIAHNVAGYSAWVDWRCGSVSGKEVQSLTETGRSA